MSLKKKVKKAIKQVGTVIKDFGTALATDTKTKLTQVVSDPKSLVSARAIKGNLRSSAGIVGKAVDGVNQIAVHLNPLDGTLKKFDLKGKKAGGIGRYLGGAGETARKKPVSTAIAVYGAVTALSSSVATEGTTTGAGMLADPNTFSGAGSLSYTGDAVNIASGIDLTFGATEALSVGSASVGSAGTVSIATGNAGNGSSFLDKTVEGAEAIAGTVAGKKLNEVLNGKKKDDNSSTDLSGNIQDSPIFIGASVLIIIAILYYIKRRRK